jgi:hypothetical protein
MLIPPSGTTVAWFNAFDLTARAAKQPDLDFG